MAWAQYARALPVGCIQGMAQLTDTKSAQYHPHPQAQEHARDRPVPSLCSLPVLLSSGLFVRH